MKKGMIITAAFTLALGISMPAGIYAANPTSNHAINVVQDEKNYDKIEISELPETVSSAIENDYAGYTVSEAYEGTDGSYKVKLDYNGEETVVFYSEDGTFQKVGGDKEWDSSMESDSLTTDPME